MAEMLEHRVSKRKHQQHGTPANQKLGHKRKPKTIQQQRAADAANEAFEVARARTADIGINPKYRNANDALTSDSAVKAWEALAARWNADHDVVLPPKPQPRKSRRRLKMPRAAKTYRAERRNALRTGPNGGMRRTVQAAAAPALAA